MPLVYDRIEDMRGNLITVKASGVSLGELAMIEMRDGRSVFASTIRIKEDLVTLQVFESSRGISTGDRVRFLHREMQATFGESLLGRRLSGAGDPVDGGPAISGEPINIGTPSVNPTRRIIPREMMCTNIPMIDMFNTLVRSQKIPIFSVAGEPYNPLLMRIANQTDADVIVLGGMGLTFNDYQAFIDNAERAGSMEKTVMYVHRATDPAVECLLVPDMALASAEKFAVMGKHVLVLLTDMTAFADAIKEIAITMDQVPSNRGYPGSLYSDLASRYEKAVLIEGSGSITIVGVTTMPGDDVTHPIPDNTGYITEGQILLSRDIHRKGIYPPVDVLPSLSRLKDKGIGKDKTREDHSDVLNQLFACYARGKEAKELAVILGDAALTDMDKLYVKFSDAYENEFVRQSEYEDRTITQTLDLGWKLMSILPDTELKRIREEYLEKYYKKS